MLARRRSGRADHLFHARSGKELDSSDVTCNSTYHPCIPHLLHQHTHMPSQRCISSNTSQKARTPLVPNHHDRAIGHALIHVGNVVDNGRNHDNCDELGQPDHQLFVQFMDFCYLQEDLLQLSFILVFAKMLKFGELVESVLEIFQAVQSTQAVVAASHQVYHTWAAMAVVESTLVAVKISRQVFHTWAAMAAESTLVAARASHQVYLTSATISLTVVRATFDLVVVVSMTEKGQENEVVVVYPKLANLMESEFTRAWAVDLH